MNTNAKKTAKQAEKGREQAAPKRAPHEPSEKAEAAFMKRMKAEAEKAAAEQAKKAAAEEEQTEPKTEEKKGEHENMKTAKKTAANAPKTAPKTAKTEPKTAAAVNIEDAPKMNRAPFTLEQIAAIRERRDNGANVEIRRKAREEMTAAVEAFNVASIENAAARGGFMNAAEALRVAAPKKDENRKPGFDYERRAEPIEYIVLNEDGEPAKRVLNLVTFARVAFMKRATTEQREAFAAALAAVEAFQKANLENDSHEGLKAAAAALTALVNVCGLNKFTFVRAENGEKYDFSVNRSFVHAAAARMKAKRGAYLTEAAAVAAADIRAKNASAANRERAEKNAARAEENAVKMIFSIISEAAAAAVVGVYRATVKTAADIRAEEDARAEAAKKAAEDRAAKKAAREAKTAAEAAKKTAKAREALKKAAEELKAAEAREAALTAAEAKKTAAA